MSDTGPGFLSRMSGSVVWRDILFVGAISGIIYYAGSLSRQIEINTGRLDALERLTLTLVALQPQVTELQRQLQRHEQQTDQLMGTILSGKKPDR